MGVKAITGLYQAFDKEILSKRQKFDNIIIDVYTVLYECFPKIKFKSTNGYIARKLHVYFLKCLDYLNKGGQLYLVFEGVNQFPLKKINRRHGINSTESPLLRRNNHIVKYLIALFKCKTNIYISKVPSDRKRKQKNVYIVDTSLHEADYKIARVLLMLAARKTQVRQKCLLISNDSDIMLTASIQFIFNKSLPKQLEIFMSFPKAISSVTKCLASKMLRASEKKSTLICEWRDKPVVYHILSKPLTLSNIINLLQLGCDYLSPSKHAFTLNISNDQNSFHELLIAIKKESGEYLNVELYKRFKIIYTLLLYYAGDEKYLEFYKEL